jgi:transposase
VLEHVRPKYACASRAAHVVIAARLPEPIEKGLPGTGLLAHVVTSKLADHLPLYRLEGIFRRHGVELARSTMCDWMAACAGLLEPVVKAMIGRILAPEVIGTDDTPVTVRDHAGKGPKEGRLWAYLGDRDHPFVVYD